MPLNTYEDDSSPAAVYNKTYISVYFRSPLNDMWVPLVSIFFLLPFFHLHFSFSSIFSQLGAEVEHATAKEAL
jgi:hypothetical protein